MATRVDREKSAFDFLPLYEVVDITPIPRKQKSCRPRGGTQKPAPFSAERSLSAGQELLQRLKPPGSAVVAMPLLTHLSAVGVSWLVAGGVL